MKGFVSPLARRKRPGYSEAVEKIERIVRTTLTLEDDTTVSLAELACREVGCPDIETVIAILVRDHDPVTIRIQAAVPDILEAELVARLLELNIGRLHVDAKARQA